MILPPEHPVRKLNDMRQRFEGDSRFYCAVVRLIKKASTATVKPKNKKDLYAAALEEARGLRALTTDEKVLKAIDEIEFHYLKKTGQSVDLESLRLAELFNLAGNIDLSHLSPVRQRTYLINLLRR